MVQELGGVKSVRKMYKNVHQVYNRPIGDRCIGDWCIHRQSVIDVSVSSVSMANRG